MLARVNDSRKEIGKQYRHSQKRKVQFLNLYEHRRLKLAEQRLLEGKQQQEHLNRSALKERARSIKLNGEVRALLLRNELEDNNAQAAARNRLAKQVVPSSRRSTSSNLPSSASSTWRPPAAASPALKPARTSFRKK
jgi:hypothetical protein